MIGADNGRRGAGRACSRGWRPVCGPGTRSWRAGTRLASLAAGGCRATSASGPAEPALYRVRGRWPSPAGRWGFLAETAVARGDRRLRVASSGRSRHAAAHATPTGRSGQAGLGPVAAASDGGAARGGRRRTRGRCTWHLAEARRTAPACWTMILPRWPPVGRTGDRGAARSSEPRNCSTGRRAGAWHNLDRQGRRRGLNARLDLCYDGVAGLCVGDALGAQFFIGGTPARRSGGRNPAARCLGVGPARR